MLPYMLQWLIPRYWRIYIITDYQIIGEGWVDKLRFKADMFAIKEYLNIPEGVTPIFLEYHKAICTKHPPSKSITAA